MAWRTVLGSSSFVGDVIQSRMTESQDWRASPKREKCHKEVQEIDDTKRVMMHCKKREVLSHCARDGRSRHCGFNINKEELE